MGTNRERNLKTATKMFRDFSINMLTWWLSL